VALLVFAPQLCQGAELSVSVLDAKGRPARDAVVYAVPHNRTVPPATRTAVMDQRDRQFVPRVLPVRTGTAVSFPNSDDVRHQVYSFSPAKRFQLPLYEGTPPNPVVFDQPGVVVLGCNIHDRMRAYIVVVDTPHFAPAPEGTAELKDLPAGSYDVRAWHPGRGAQPAERRVDLEAGDALSLELPSSAE